MQRRNILLIILIIAMLDHCDCQQYLTNNERTATLKTRCSEPRASFIDNYDKYQASFAEEQTKNSFSLDGNQFLINIGDSEYITRELNKNRGQIVLYFGFFVVPLFIMIIMAPLLLCCCLCSRSCPVCQCCRQPYSTPYTNGQNKFPAAMIAILAIVIIACMIYALAYPTSPDKVYRDTRCAIAITFDDILNGNVSISDNTSYFLGLQPAKDTVLQIKSRQAQALAVLDPITTDGSVITSVNADFTSLLSEIENIPDGSGGSLVLNYNSPIIDTAPLNTIPSTFPSVLGSKGQNATWVDMTYLKILTNQAFINAISLLSDAVESAFIAFNAQIDNIVAQLDKFINSVSKTNSDVDRQMTNFEQVVRIVNIVFYVFASLVLLFAFLMMVGALMAGCCQKYSCRHLVYVSCGLLCLFGIFLFLLAIVFSIVTPAGYYICDYLKVGVRSPEGFKSNFGPLINNNQLTQVLSQCSTTGSGQIVEQLIGSQTITLITEIKSLVTSLKNYNASDNRNAINQNMEMLVSNISDYRNARVLDIESQTDIDSLNKVSDSTQYGACTAPGFSDDSWIPSISQNPEYVTCKVSGLSSNYDTCGNNDANVINRASGCTGCMDTYDIFEAKTTKAEVLTLLNGRYLGCVTFNTELSNIWGNFYQIKKDEIQPVENRAIAAQASASALGDRLVAQVGPAFTSALTTLQSSFSAILDPQYGLLSSFNCKIFAQDINLALNIVCSFVFTYAFILRILCAIAAWAIMFIMCFSVCLGVRSQKSSRLKQDQYLDNAGDYGSSQQFGTAKGYY